MEQVETFHRYRLVRRIARGGMAEVFLASHRGAAGFERRVALKKILPVYTGMEEFASLFRDEARISAVLDHSGIVQVYDFGRYEGEYYIAMEYVDGPDLEEVLDRCRRRGVLPPVEVVLHIAHRLASCLEYAHTRLDPDGFPLDIIHRDVSPPNVLLGVQGELKLTDFGVAKAALRDSATRPGVLRGKYAYMSPEQVGHRELDQRSDLFSVGILLYETLTGVNPFERSTDFQTMESVGKADVEPPGLLRPDTPAAFDRIVMTCLESSPSDRFPDAGSLRREMAALIRDYPRSEDPQVLVEFLQHVFPERGDEEQRVARGQGEVPLWEAMAHRLSPMLVSIPLKPGGGPGPIRLVHRPVGGGDEGVRAPDLGSQDDPPWPVVADEVIGEPTDLPAMPRMEGGRQRVRAVFREVGPKAHRKRKRPGKSEWITGSEEEDVYQTDPSLAAARGGSRPRPAFLPAADESLDHISRKDVRLLGAPEPEVDAEQDRVGHAVPPPFAQLAEGDNPLLRDLAMPLQRTSEGVPIVNEWDLDEGDWGGEADGDSSEDDLTEDMLRTDEAMPRPQEPMPRPIEGGTHPAVAVPTAPRAAAPAAPPPEPAAPPAPPEPAAPPARPAPSAQPAAPDHRDPPEPAEAREGWPQRVRMPATPAGLALGSDEDGSQGAADLPSEHALAPPPDGEFIPGWDVPSQDGLPALSDLLSQASVGGTRPSAPGWTGEKEAPKPQALKPKVTRPAVGVPVGPGRTNAAAPAFQRRSPDGDPAAPPARRRRRPDVDAPPVRSGRPVREFRLSEPGALPPEADAPSALKPAPERAATKAVEEEPEKPRGPTVVERLSAYKVQAAYAAGAVLIPLVLLLASSLVTGPRRVEPTPTPVVSQQDPAAPPPRLEPLEPIGAPAPGPHHEEQESSAAAP